MFAKKPNGFVKVAKKAIPNPWHIVIISFAAALLQYFYRMIRDYLIMKTLLSFLD